MDALIQSLLIEGIHHSKAKPSHVIVHIPPEMEGCIDTIRAVLEMLSITGDIVVVERSAHVRFWQRFNRQGTPSHGIAVGSETHGISYLMNTLSFGDKTNRGYIVPNPGVVAARRVVGVTPMQDLAAHVFWLSVAHVNALHRTVDMPIAIAYMDIPMWRSHHSGEC